MSPTLKSVRDEKPIRYATVPTLDLVLEELALTGELDRLEELGGRKAVEALVEDRPELRDAQASLSAALLAVSPVESEPVVLFAAAELGADQGVHEQLEKVDASTFPGAAVASMTCACVTSMPSMPSTNVAALPSWAPSPRYPSRPSRAPVTRRRQRLRSRAPVTEPRRRGAGEPVAREAPRE